MEQIRYEIQSFFKKTREQMSSLDKPQQEKLMGSSYIALSLFAVAFFSIFAIYPTLGTIANLKRQYDDNTLVDQQLDKKISALTELERQYNILSEHTLPLIMNAIPQSPEIPSFTRKVESIAKTNNVTINFFNVGTAEVFPADKMKNGFRTLDFSMTVEGSRAGTNAFINSLASFDRVITLDSQTRAKGEDTEQSVNISGALYFNK